jgi:L-fuconolactonase
MNMIIDSHQHFWKYDPVRDSWITDDMQVLKKDYLPADLEEVYKVNKVDGSVVVQADQSEKETEFLLSLGNQNAFIKAVVGWTDLKSPQLESKLQDYARFAKLKGFRAITQGQPDEAYFLNKDFHQGISVLNHFNYTYDILIYHYQFKAAIKFVEKFPDQHFMLDHLGKPDIKGQEFKKWKEQIRIMSAHPNLFCKLSGMITEAHWQKWRYEDVNPYLEIAAEYFGVDRLCFGSDWPVCLVAGKYAEVLDIVQKFVRQVSEKDQKKIMAENAIKFYNLS